MISLGSITTKTLLIWGDELSLHEGQVGVWAVGLGKSFDVLGLVGEFEFGRFSG